LDNFQRFCELLAKLATVRKIVLQTGTLEGDEEDQSDSRLEDLRRHLGAQQIEFEWRRVAALHYRQVRTDHGWLILSDRGLDLFKKPEGRNAFGHFDLALRRCKPTKIHVRRTL